MVNYYDEPQDNGSNIPLIVGGLAGAGGAGYLANKHWSGTAHGLGSDKLDANSNLGKVKAGLDAIKKAEATSLKDFEAAQDKLTADSWEKNFDKLDADTKKAVSVDGNGKTYSAVEAEKHLKAAGAAKLNPVQYETAIHELEELSRLPEAELKAHPKGQQFTDMLGDISSDGKTVEARLAETHLHKNPQLLEDLAKDVAKDADHTELKDIRATRAQSSHPAVAAHAEVHAQFEGKTAEQLKESLPKAKPDGWKAMSSEVRQAHTNTHATHKAALTRAEALEKAEEAISKVKDGGTEMTEELKKSMHDKHGFTRANAAYEHAVANHPKVTPHLSSVAEESKGIMNKVKNVKGGSKLKVAAAAVAGAAVVGGIANKMFGGPSPSTRVDPAQMQMMGQQQAAMGV